MVGSSTSTNTWTDALIEYGNGRSRYPCQSGPGLSAAAEALPPRAYESDAIAQDIAEPSRVLPELVMVVYCVQAAPGYVGRRSPRLAPCQPPVDRAPVRFVVVTEIAERLAVRVADDEVLGLLLHGRGKAGSLSDALAIP